MLTGGCSCGYVRYEADSPPLGPAICHCVDCRKATGAPLVAWFSIGRADFRFTAGEPALFRSSSRATRQFCPRCGTPLTFQADGTPGEIDVTTGSLDQPEAAPPRAHLWTSQRLSWIELADGLPQHDRDRSADPGGA